MMRPSMSMFPALQDKAWLTSELASKSVRHIAKELGCSHPTVRFALQYHGIAILFKARRIPQLHDKQWLQDAIDRTQDTAALADELGCTTSAINRAMSRHGLPPLPPITMFPHKADNRTLIRLFFLHVEKTPTCWLWQRSRFQDGYGRLQYRRTTHRAHRFIYELIHGLLLPTVLVCHDCDNPPCVRPDHLFPGSGYDNLQDMVRKGRSLRGEANHHSSLTEDDVRIIRTLYASGARLQRELATMFSVNQTAISSVILRKSWGHVAP